MGEASKAAVVDMDVFGQLLEIVSPCGWLFPFLFSLLEGS